eukprot:354533-Chlamydomonas_euryale.AAC.4
MKSFMATGAFMPLLALLLLLSPLQDRLHLQPRLGSAVRCLAESLCLGACALHQPSQGLAGVPEGRGDGRTSRGLSLRTAQLLCPGCRAASLNP